MLLAGSCGHTRLHCHQLSTPCGSAVPGERGCFVKYGTPSHPKTADLAAALRIERWGAVGILESLWLWTAEYAPDGAVGRYHDQAIADAIGWKGDARKLIRALVKARWLDKASSPIRLVVHDWSDHATDQVHRKLVRGSSRFANGMPPKLNKATQEERERYRDILGVSGESRGTAEGFTGHVPDQTIPNSTQPETNQTAPSSDSAGSGKNALDGWTGLEFVRFLVNGTPNKPATHTVETLCHEISDEQLKTTAHQVYKMKLSGELTRDAAAFLTTRLKGIAQSGPSVSKYVSADQLAKRVGRAWDSGNGRPLSCN